MTKSSKILLIVAVSAILITGVAIAITQGLRTLSSNFGLTQDFSDLEESDRQVTYPFTFTELPEYFEAGLTLEGSGYAGQPHSISLWIGHSRPDSSVWLASGDYSLLIKNESSYSEPIISNSFSGLRNTVPFEDNDHSWTSPSDNGTYDFVLSLTNLDWIKVNYYNITATADPGGSISPNGTITVLEGDSQDFVITPDPGYVIHEVTLTGVNMGNESAYRILVFSADQIIHATFTQLETTLVSTTWTDVPFLNIIEVGVTFDGSSVPVSYYEGDTVSFAWTVEANIPNELITYFKYQIDIRPTIGGDWIITIPFVDMYGSWADGIPIELSGSFPAPAYGDYDVRIIITGVSITPP